jgi:CRISPR-associated endonuclease Csn1
MRYRLGLDLGANSLGWAVLQLEPKVSWYDAKPVGIVASGVRMFDAGVDGSIEQGKDSSRGAERRQARQTRRQTWRRQYRKLKLFGLLQRLNHLPKTDSREPDVRDSALKSLDESLTAKWCPEGDIDAHQKMPYLLRAAALDQLLEPHELGRALYHLGQRRGYKANRKTDIVDDEESGKVAAGISTLDRARFRDPEDLSSQRTLAQTVRDEFGQVNGRFVLRSEDPASPTRGRIRKHYTSRKMYYDEFIAIRDAQLRFGTPIEMGDWKRLEKALFHQRPLKSQKHLVGRCTLEKDKHGRGRRRCTVAMLDFQEFRLLQTVNHLRIVLPGQPSQPLSDEQRQILIDHLQIHGDLLLKAPTRRSKTRSSASVESLLDLPKGTGFSLTPFQDAGDANDDADEDDDKKLIGNRTAAKLRPIFGDRWDKLTDSEREQLILHVLYISNPDSLKKLAIRKWQLSPDAAEALSRVTLEEGFGGLSRTAIRKLLPELRNALSYGEARKKIYPDSFKASEPKELLPPLSEWNDDVRNPAVIRALTEVRKVVNAIVRQYGKPEQIHIELARDLKRSRKERQEIWKKNEDQRKLRDKAVKRILEELGVSNPRRDTIDKWLLADECNWECAYTGKSITPRTLEQFDVEHIFPRQYLDDSFANKTLCEHDFNRNRKKNRLPSEVLSGEEFDVVIARVKRFNGSAAIGKLKRFQREDVPEDFVARQLNDTRYNARLAADFLGTLYGGRSDAENHQRIVTPTGNLTWILRTGWGLNCILSDSDDKDRRDNRHHAVDAVCIALATQKTINLAADLAKNKFLAGERFNRFLQEMPKKTPWDNFLETVGRSIDQIIVSHRPTRRIAGPLHAETNYSKPFVKHEKPPTAVNAGGKGKASRPKPPVVQYRVRKSLDKLTEKDILSEAIADPNVRAAVQQKYEELCALATTKADRTPAKMWSDLAKIDNFPRLSASEKRLKKGESTLGSPIFKVRLVTDTKPRTVGKGSRQRQVASGKDSNYATMIYAIHDMDGKEIRWEHEIITRLDAHLRLSANGGGRGRRKGANRDDDKGEPAEQILTPRTSGEVRDMVDAPFKLKAGETVRFLFALVKNDMVELDGPDEKRVVYRLQKLSVSELQLCEHVRGTIANDERTPWNRITSLATLKNRNIRVLQLDPLGRVQAAE